MGKEDIYKTIAMNDEADVIGIFIVAVVVSVVFVFIHMRGYTIYRSHTYTY
jgi:hypothetical protein